MNVDRQLVDHVARLAHLKLSEEETVFYQEQLGRILSYVRQLDQFAPISEAELDVAHSVPSERPDQVQPCLGPEKAVSQAPEKSGTFFQVPRIIE